MSNDRVTLKEHFNERVDNLEKLSNERIENLRNDFDTYIENTNRALNLQATETERRLDGLNNEAGRIAKVLESTVPRELYQSEMKDVRGSLDDLKKYKNFGSGREYQLRINVALIFSIISALGVVFSIFFR